MPRVEGSPVAPAAEMVLLLAGTERRRSEAAARISALAAIISTSDVADEMDRHRSRLVLGTRARALGITSSSFDKDLAKFLGWAERRSMLFESLTRTLVGHLEDRGVPALPLKGSQLAASAHGNAAMRISGDIDLLIGREHIPTAMHLLREVGY